MSTFEYWNFLRRELTNVDIIPHISNSNYSFIPEAYLEVFKIVTEKCKATSLKLVSSLEASQNTMVNANKDDNENFDEGNGANYLGKEDITIQEYRSFAKDVLYSCYAILLNLRGEEGINALFSLVIPVLTEEYVTSRSIDLNQPSVRTEYLLTCEVLIFSIRCTLDHINHENPDKYIIEIIKHIIKLPKEKILIRGCLYFLKAAAEQIKFIPEYIDVVYNYCLSEANDLDLIIAIAEVSLLWVLF